MEWYSANLSKLTSFPPFGSQWVDGKDDANAYAEISRIERETMTSRKTKFQSETLPDDIYKYMREFKLKTANPNGMAVVIFSHGHLISGLLDVSKSCIGNGAVTVAAYKMGTDTARTETRTNRYRQVLRQNSNPLHSNPGPWEESP